MYAHGIHEVNELLQSHMILFRTEFLLKILHTHVTAYRLQKRKKKQIVPLQPTSIIFRMSCKIALKFARCRIENYRSTLCSCSYSAHCRLTTVKFNIKKNCGAVAVKMLLATPGKIVIEDSN